MRQNLRLKFWVIPVKIRKCLSVADYISHRKTQTYVPVYNYSWAIKHIRAHSYLFCILQQADSFYPTLHTESPDNLPAEVFCSQPCCDFYIGKRPRRPPIVVPHCCFLVVISGKELCWVSRRYMWAKLDSMFVTVTIDAKVKQLVLLFKNLLFIYLSRF